MYIFCKFEILLELFLGWVGEVALEVFQHPAHPLLLLTEHRLHRLVRLEVHLELLILQLLLLDVGVQLLHHLPPGQLLPLLGPDDLGEGGGDLKLGVDALPLVGRHLRINFFKKLLSSREAELKWTGASKTFYHGAGVSIRV